MQLKRPYKLIDLDVLAPDLAAEKVVAFINDYDIEVLNVAGPRASGCPAVYGYTKQVIAKVIKAVSPE